MKYRDYERDVAYHEVEVVEEEEEGHGEGVEEDGGAEVRVAHALGQQQQHQQHAPPDVGRHVHLHSKDREARRSEGAHGQQRQGCDPRPQHV